MCVEEEEEVEEKMKKTHFHRAIIFQMYLALRGNFYVRI